MYAANTWIMFESCVHQSDILFSLDFDANGPVEPVNSFSTVGRRKSSTGAAERRCHPHLKLSDIFPTTHTCGKNGPMTFSCSGPLVSCPPQLCFLTPPPQETKCRFYTSAYFLFHRERTDHTLPVTPELCELGGLLHLLV